MPPTSAADRPWALYVMDPSPDAPESDWEVWSTYRGSDKALDRARQLTRKGYRARVVDSTTGASVAPSTQSAPEPSPCQFCGDLHSTPSQGECLI